MTNLFNTRSYLIIGDNADDARVAELLSTDFAGTVLHSDPDSEWAEGIIVIGNHFEADNLPEADERCSNGSSTVRLYRVDGATVFVESGDNDALGIWPAGASLRAFFHDWDFGDTEWTDGIAAFGFDIELEEADDSDTDVRVWVSPIYYPGTIGAVTAYYACDEDGDDLVFETHAAAQYWIDQDSAGYVLSHGEADRPTYTIV
jgi:hypothetical protein